MQSQRQYDKIGTDVARISRLESNLQTVVQRIDNVEKKFEYVINRTKHIDESTENIGHVVHRIVDKCKENISDIANLLLI